MVLRDLQAHRRTVLWELYRPLLRVASKLQADTGDELHSHVRRNFRRGIKLANEQRIHNKLQEARQVSRSRAVYCSALTPLHATQLLHQWQSAVDGNAYHTKQVQYLTQYLRAMSARSVQAPATVSEKKPIRTPGIMHATAYHDPLPRLKPQPHSTSMMIFNRRRQIQRRWDRLETMKAWTTDARDEQRFERGLGVQNRDVEWGTEWSNAVKASEASMTRERHRSEVSDCLTVQQSSSTSALTYSSSSPVVQLRIPPTLQSQAKAAQRHRDQRWQRGDSANR